MPDIQDIITKFDQVIADVVDQNDSNPITTSLNELKSDILNEHENIANTLKNYISNIDILKRALADSDNTIKQQKNQFNNASQKAVSDVFRELVNVVDNFDRCILHRPNIDSPEVETLIVGIKMINVQLKAIFEKFNIQTINPNPGDAFDSAVHQVTSVNYESEFDSNKIVNLVQIGYQMQNNLLIRPAMVVISKKT